MVRGSSLIKVRPNGRTYNRYFSLDEDLSSLRWIPTSKKASKAAGNIQIHIGKAVTKYMYELVNQI